MKPNLSKHVPAETARGAPRIEIRWMIRRDMPEVLAIEAEGFEFPWLEEDFICCVRRPSVIPMVGEHDGRVVGFMVYELARSRIDLLNLAVAGDCRRRGVGRQMVEKLCGKLSQQRRTAIVLEVRETNLPAQQFFRAMGFRAEAVLRAHYEDTPEDAYRMCYRLPEHYQPGEALNRLAALEK